MHILCTLAAAALLGLAAMPATAHDITAKRDPKVPGAFDIIGATAATDGRLATFSMEVSGKAGSMKPEKVGKLHGSKADAYV